MSTPWLLDQNAMRERDRLACAVSGGELHFMERAAQAALDWILPRFGADGKLVLILAGSGNNGGDALALAALLHGAGRAVEAWYLPGRSGRTTEAWRHQAARLASAGLQLREWTLAPGALEAVARRAALVVDGLAGIGQQGPLEGAAAAAAAVIDGLDGGTPVLALDLPSGLHDGWRPGDPALRASTTLCFDHAKSCLYHPAARPLAGDILVADIGFPADLPPGMVGRDTPRLLLESDLPRLMPEVSPFGHKFERGSVGLLAGSRRYPGAALLAARAAARSRAGMVRLLADPDLADMLRPVAAELLVSDLDPAVPLPAGSLERLDAALAGPGWDRGTHRPGQLAALLAGLAGRNTPLVLDADGLQALARLPEPPVHAGLILTPHTGELAALSGVAVADILADPLPVLRRTADRYGAVVLLKGPVTWIAAPEAGVRVLDAANPVLAQAGSGDVLAGIMVAILAALTRSGEPAGTRCLKAAQAAGLILAAAGRRLAQTKGWGTSSDLVEQLPQTWAEFDPPRCKSTAFLD